MTVVQVVGVTTEDEEDSELEVETTGVDEVTDSDVDSDVVSSLSPQSVVEVEVIVILVVAVVQFVLEIVLHVLHHGKPLKTRLVLVFCRQQPLVQRRLDLVDVWVFERYWIDLLVGQFAQYLDVSSVSFQD
ncbi:hypothetical protein OGAPHI_004110 [Ogataea philodendri]|uniref:Uncharacterized protein n=1 Tax=Ogataea philodendri TaxID=1378263 RepID=A0A9P8P6H9_9ASCO|nr:uncharacterized protein OGAPHI_004110 [Ogataea philodendri]KAH3665921.1 hypothetical protein OGAPHI_004110 [Ogataea philodendri]